MTRSAFFAVILATVLSCIVASAHAEEGRTTAMKISIKIKDEVITATLMDNPTSRDFVALLPMSLTLEDHAATEKISDLSRSLSTEGAPAGSDPSIGDIAYYSPWGNVAIFYKDFRYSTGLIKLGRIDSGIEALSVPGSTKVTIELIEESQLSRSRNKEEPAQ